MNPIGFLLPLHMCSIHPETGRIIGQICETELDVKRWIKQHPDFNNYYTLNEVKGNINKPRKEHIIGIRGIGVDLDGDKDESLDKLKDFPEASWVMDSGNGIQAVWLCSCEPSQAERIGRAAADKLGGDRVQNIDRLYRMWGTTNWPDERKKKKGRKKTETKLLSCSGMKYDVDQLHAAFGAADLEVQLEIAPPSIDRTLVEDMDFFESVWLRVSAHIEPLLEGHPTEGQVDLTDSGFNMAIMAKLKRLNLEPNEAFAVMYWTRWDQLDKQGDGWRQMERTWTRNYVKTAVEEFEKRELELIPGEDGRTNDEDTLMNMVYVKDQAMFYDHSRKHYLGVDQVSLLFIKQFPGGKQIPKAPQYFMENGGRIVDRCLWWPDRPRTFWHEDQFCFNTYDKPEWTEEEGDVSIWLDHLKMLVHNPSEREVILDWMAFNLQNIGTKLNFHILHGGTPGIGKDLFYQPLKRALGRYAKVIKATSLLEQFNDYLEDCKLLLIEEVYAYDRLDIDAKLKHYATSPPDTIPINVKFQRMKHVPNLVSLLLFSNHENAMMLDRNDRRFFCVWSGGEPQPNEYYGRLVEWYENGGYEKVITWLMKREVRLNPKSHAPETEFKEQIKRSSSSGLFVLLHDAVMEEDGPFSGKLFTTKDVHRYVSQYEKNITYRKIEVELKQINSLHRVKDGKVLQARGLPKVRLWTQNPQFWNSQTDADIVKAYHSDDDRTTMDLLDWGTDDR